MNMSSLAAGADRPRLLRYAHREGGHPPVGTDGIDRAAGRARVGRAALWLIAGFVEIIFRFTMSGLLRRNLLGHVLDRPGAHALPYSIGETISRFPRRCLRRPRTAWIGRTRSWARAVFAVVAFLVLLRIDARMTLVASSFPW